MAPTIHHATGLGLPLPLLVQRVFDHLIARLGESRGLVCGWTVFCIKQVNSKVSITWTKSV